MRVDIRLCAWALLISVVLIICEGIFGHMAPPPPASMPAGAVAAFYSQYHRQILLFAVLNGIGCTLEIPASCALAVALRRMQPRSLLLAIIVGVCGIFGTVGAYFGGLFFAAAAVPADPLPQVVASINDLGVIFFEMTVLPVFLQGIAIAAAIFRDRSPDPIFPRWLAWLYLAYGVCGQTGFISIFFKTGPLAATGFFGLILPMLVFFIWQLGTVLALFLIKPQQWAEADLSGLVPAFDRAS